jgi:hypothetical protein
VSLAFLAAAGEVLAASLDFHQTLQKVTKPVDPDRVVAIVAAR